jgi:phospholipase/carboxylesterase
MEINGLTLVQSGLKPEEAEKVLIMLHGRGDRAENFIAFSQVLNLQKFAVFALQAEGNTWYPYSFLVDIKSNEPYLSNSLRNLDTLVNYLKNTGFATDRIYFLGFSQGACLALEYTSRNARQYGGVIAFTGGLIGERLEVSRYQGDFKGTPVFIGSSDYDPHVPEYRIDESEKIISNLTGSVNKVIYPGLGHTINQDEIENAKEILNQ